MGVSANASLDGRPAHLELQSPRLVLIDPLALDGLRAELEAVAAAPPAEQPGMLRALAAQGLRIGLEEIAGFQPGLYQLDPDSFARASAGDSDPGVFEIDSGTVVVIDLAALAPVARALTWDRYDELLQSPVDDDSRLVAINDDAGGPRFAIVGGDASRGFSGDGAFRLLSDRVLRVG